MLLTQKTLIALIAVTTVTSFANAQAPAARGGARGERPGAEAPRRSTPPTPAPEETKPEPQPERRRPEARPQPSRPTPPTPPAPMPERERPEHDRPSRPTPPPRPPQRPERDVDQDGIPDRVEATRRYSSARVSLAGVGPFDQPFACLQPIGRWSNSEQGAWGLRNSSGGYVEFDMDQNCDNYRSCQSNDFQPPAEPGDCGQRTRLIHGDNKTLSLTSEKSVSVEMISVEKETEKVCSLAQLSETTCKDDGRRRPFAVNGVAQVENIDRDGNVLRSEVYRFSDNVWGHDLERVRPYEWQAAYPSHEIQRFSTAVSVSVLPVDFPKAYNFSASVSHTEGSIAQFSFSSKYFAHNARLVSDNGEAQAFEVSSKIQPIAAPNVSIAFDPTTYLVTITDNSSKELAEIDPKNSATYTLSVYGNWKRTFGDEKLGSLLPGDGKKLTVNTNGNQVTVVSIKDELLNHPKFKKEKFDGGGKDWEAYIEVSTARQNKYVRAAASEIAVTKFTIAKKKVLKNVETGFTKTGNYRN